MMKNIRFIRIVDLDDRLWYYTGLRQQPRGQSAILEEIRLELLKDLRIPFGLN